MDSLGFPFFTHCTKANVSDDAGLIEMLTIHIDYFKDKPPELPKTTILLDNGYHPERLTRELQRVYPDIMSKIRFEVSPKPSKETKAAQGRSEFVPIKARWVVERSHAWVEWCRSLAKNTERTLFAANSKLKLCFIRLMIKRAAAS